MLSLTSNSRQEQWSFKKSKVKRPKLVWAITIFFAISVPFMLLSVFLALTGRVPLGPAMQAYYESLSAFDYGLSILMGVLNVVGAISLFRLRKSAVWLFAVALGLNGLLALSYTLSTNWIEAMAETGVLGDVFVGWAIGLGIVFYAWRLKHKGVLT